MTVMPEREHIEGTDRGCSNCGKPLREHHCVHLVPCCPGRCPGDIDDAAVMKFAPATNEGGSKGNGHA